jgi:hypothetical protein
MKTKLFFGEKKHEVRAAGLKTEKKFFGPRGVFAKAGHTKHLKKHNPQRRSTGFTWDQMLDYLGNEGWKPTGKKYQAVFHRRTGSLFQILQLEARAWRVLYRTFLTAGASPALSLGTYEQLDAAMIAANRQANDWIGKGKRNPITVVGNPPKRIRAKVKGVMYNKVHEVQAEKTGQHKHKGFWYHPFKGKTSVQMLALDSGDILLHSKAGKRLWKED